MAVATVVIDDIDRALLGLLRKMGRMSYRDLGEEVDLAAHVTGPFDYLILMSVAGVPRLDDIVRTWGHSFLAETSTRILLHTVELANQPG